MDEHVTPTNGWNQWEKLIVYRLDTLTSNLENLTEHVSNLANSLTAGQARLSEEITAVKIKSGMWGAVTGAIATALGGLGVYLTKH